MSERTLFIWSGPERADLEPLKRAKAQLELDFMVRPVGVPVPNGENALPSECGRVLAIGHRPPWLCDYALVGERTSEDGWRAALEWALGVVDHDPRATTTLDILASIFPGIEEIMPEQLEAEEKLRAYVSGYDD